MELFEISLAKRKKKAREVEYAGNFCGEAARKCLFCVVLFTGGSAFQLRSACWPPPDSLCQRV